MSRKALNLGILAHVDAGKTTLTERLLYSAGAIDGMGSVDKGTTQTDSLALERQRGITIKSAVASFAVGDVVVNLIDTPGHPDFIAEVDRVLDVLDGAVLVISAVEGVQPQTRILFRTLRRLGVPTLIFVNKIDRKGASVAGVLDAISERLDPAIIALGSAHREGTRDARIQLARQSDPEFVERLALALADNDESLLADLVEDGANIRYRRLRRLLARQTARCLIRPVVPGSALTGAGVGELISAVVGLLPGAAGDPGGPINGTIFKIERGKNGERVAYVRMRTGTLRIRDRVRLGDCSDGKVNAINVFDRGAPQQRGSVHAGQIAKLWGLAAARVGDSITAANDSPGRGVGRENSYRFAPPTLEAAVDPVEPSERQRLRIALGQLAEQDPLINLRQTNGGRELRVSLYGEVQKEVLQATLAAEYQLEVSFRDATPLYIERPVAEGEGLELLHAPTNPYFATIGLRIEPAAAGSGVEFRVDVDPRTLPLYLFKTNKSFIEHMRAYVHETLDEGLSGWQVTDCLVTLHKFAYSIPDGPPSRRGPASTHADFRYLTPIVMRQAVTAAGTVVCEPIVRASIEIPLESLRSVVRALGSTPVETSSVTRSQTILTAVLPAARGHELQRMLPDLTGGEGLIETTFCGYAPLTANSSIRQH